MYGTYEGVTLSGNPSGTTYDLMNAIISCNNIPQYTSFFKVLNYDHLEQISLDFHMPLNKVRGYGEQKVETSVNSIPFFQNLEHNVEPKLIVTQVVIILSWK